MKYFVLLSLIISPLCYSESFSDFNTNLSKVGGYSQNVNYDSQHCMVHFESTAPTECSSNKRGVIYLEKNIGELMCSVALTALVSGRKVNIASHDECDPIHNAPVIRYIEIVN